MHLVMKLKGYLEKDFLDIVAQVHSQRHFQPNLLLDCALPSAKRFSHASLLYIHC